MLPETFSRIERVFHRLKTNDSIPANIRYLAYLGHHKYAVGKAMLFLGLPWWRCLIHDWQKLTRAEFGPYTDTFYRNESPRRADGGYDPTAVSEEFTRAWLHHVHYGPHHWQYWCLVRDDGSVQTLRLPETYQYEMVADWMGAGRSVAGTWNPLEWYRENRDKMMLHEGSRLGIEMKMVEATRLVVEQQFQEGILGHMEAQR